MHSHTIHVLVTGAGRQPKKKKGGQGKSAAQVAASAQAPKEWKVLLCDAGHGCSGAAHVGCCERWKQWGTLPETWYCSVQCKPDGQ